ncbi:protein chromatin remodeling 5 [Phtheirospermum japonicum]|uniref:Protein chromatin remodeling 5 n=1 Tax=Phtheirospermum japonicum TaxID=374723 RepID=A0A830C4Q1_9LAMI|nr:protein chromatin remodeling 5 [Phtheirospermum japonicum]
MTKLLVVPPMRVINSSGDVSKMLKLKGRKFEGSDVSIEKKIRTSQSEVNVTESNGMKNDEKANADNSVSDSRREGLDFLLRRVKIDSQSFSLGDILDEFIQQTLGTDISVHIDSRLRVSRSKRRVALKSFNDKANMKFVCLMETRSYTPSVTLSSIDTVIFFNSDWNLINHLKALQRIEFDSRFQDLNVFRFYSSHTLEEKVLI